MSIYKIAKDMALKYRQRMLPTFLINIVTKIPPYLWVLRLQLQVRPLYTTKPSGFTSRFFGKVLCTYVDGRFCEDSKLPSRTLGINTE